MVKHLSLVWCRIATFSLISYLLVNPSPIVYMSLVTHTESCLSYKILLKLLHQRADHVKLYQTWRTNSNFKIFWRDKFFFASIFWICISPSQIFEHPPPPWHPAPQIGPALAHQLFAYSTCHKPAQIVGLVIVLPLISSLLLFRIHSVYEVPFDYSSIYF